MNVGFRHLEIAKERVGHRRIVMLAGVNKNWLKLGAAPLHGRHERRYFHEVGTRAGDEDDLEHLRSRNQLELRITLSNGQKALGATLHDSVRSVPPHRQEFQRRYRSEQDHAVESSHDADRPPRLLLEYDCRFVW